jgi:hypothetical protein
MDDLAGQRMEAMRQMALKQLELNYRLAAISGLVANPQYLANGSQIEGVLEHADAIGKACMLKWEAMGQKVNSPLWVQMVGRGTRPSPLTMK